MKAVYLNNAVLKASGVLAAVLLTGAISRADEVTVTSVGVTPAYNTWYKDDTRLRGTGEVTGTYATSGDGSYQMTTQSSITGNASDAKSNASLYWDASNTLVANPFGGVTTVGSLQSLSYDWYRSSLSTVSANAMPAFRFYFKDPNSTRTGSLVYEYAYNAVGAAPVDQWTHVEFSSPNALLWMRDATPGGQGNLDLANNVYTLADWTNGNIAKNFGYTVDPSWLITGVSVSFGSGIQGVFDGAIDNVNINFGGTEHTYNFNLTAVPEPGTLALGGLGIAGLAGWYARRRRQENL